jgi:hypothetical protein
VREFDRAVARVRELDRELALTRDRRLALTRELQLAIEPSIDVGKVRTILDSLRQQEEPEEDSVSVSRKRLLGCLLEILLAKDDKFAVQRAELDYELCLFDLVRPHLSRDSLVKLTPIELTLRLLLSRRVGELEPYEGILLVRDKILA